MGWEEGCPSPGRSVCVKSARRTGSAICSDTPNKLNLLIHSVPLCLAFPSSKWPLGRHVLVAPKGTSSSRLVCPCSC